MSAWIAFVKKHWKSVGGSYKNALKTAGVEWRKQKGKKGKGKSKEEAEEPKKKVRRRRKK
jgi:hypothetical protein